MASARIEIAFLLAACVGGSLAGCSDDGSSDTAAALSARVGVVTGRIHGPTEAAPAISGSPDSSVAVGTAYRFLPTATDIDGDTLVFSVKNLPTWATFDTATGQLGGTPTAANVGNSAQIVITVSDGTLSASLAAFAIAVVQPAAATTPAPGAATTGAASPSSPATASTPTTGGAANAGGATAGTPAAGTPASGTPASGTPAPAPPKSSPDAVSLSGSPALSATVGAAYSFRPTATDSAAHGLTFTVANLPGWAKFDISSGTISGTPAAANAGQSAPITLSASDGTATAKLAPFVITVTQPATASAQLSWVAPASATDGSVAQLAGYHIYYGSSAGSLTHVIDVAGAGSTSYALSGLTHGTWYFAVTAYSSASVESTLSAVVPVTL